MSRHKVSHLNHTKSSSSSSSSSEEEEEEEENFQDVIDDSILKFVLKW